MLFNAKVLGLFLASAVAAGATAWPGSADAYWRERSSQYCVGHGWDDVFPLGHWIDNGLWWSGPSTGTLLCPIGDDAAMPKNTITLVNVSGIDNHPAQQAAAAACVTWAGGGTCGAYKTHTVAQPGTYNVGLSGADLQVWKTHPWAFASVAVQLPPRSGIGMSTLAGIYEHNL